MNDLIQRLTSRKFLLAVVGMLAAFGLPLTTEQLTAITALIIAYTATEGAIDYATRTNEVYKIDITEDHE